MRQNTKQTQFKQVSWHRAPLPHSIQYMIYPFPKPQLLTCPATWDIPDQVLHHTHQGFIPLGYPSQLPQYAPYIPSLVQKYYCHKHQSIWHSDPAAHGPVIGGENAFWVARVVIWRSWAWLLIWRGYIWPQSRQPAFCLCYQPPQRRTRPLMAYHYNRY